MDGIVDCAKKFFEYAKFAEQGLPLDEESFRKTVGGDIKSKNGVVLLLKDGPYGEVVGGIAGKVGPYWMNFGIKILFERFFWINEQYRGTSAVRMIRKFESAGAKIGAKKTAMIAINTHLFDGVKRLYEKCGYSHIEGYFIKDMG